MRWATALISVLFALSALAVAQTSDLPHAASSKPTTHSVGSTVDLHEHPFAGKQPVDVTIGLYVTNLAVVEETREQFQVEGYFTLEWDDPRLALPEAARVPGHLRKMNPDDIWTPEVETANMVSHSRGVFQFVADDAGHLRYVERSDTTVSTTYHLRKFPFDSQVLEFRGEPFLPVAGEFRFTAQPAALTGTYPDANSGLAAWKVKGLRYESTQTQASGALPSRSQAVFRILVKRRSGFYLWKIFLPMILMAIIPWAVFWYEVQDFTGQMSVPLAIILSMVAFQLAIAKDLPRVGYVTFLDAVFLASFIFVFLCIVEIVIVYILQVRRRSDIAEKIRRAARWAFPVGYAVFLILLWTFYSYPAS